MPIETDQKPIITYTLKEEEFKPMIDGQVSMYVCGPTVYNDPHIGNARPVVFFDTVARFFKAIGYEVTFVSNFTECTLLLIITKIIISIVLRNFFKIIVCLMREDRQSVIRF